MTRAPELMEEHVAGTEGIERDIEQARDQLASTLDELATRVHPKNLLEKAKITVSSALSEAKVQAALVGVGVLVVVVLVRRRD